jgi:uncharacterized protein (TIGR03435 family)
MRRVGIGIGIFALLAALGLAQAPSFEVASVKPAAPQPAGMMRVMMQGGPGTPDPGRLTYTNVTLRNVVMNAYNVRSFQVTGPKSLDSDRYDITAKIPPETTKEQFRLMLQGLLTERFALKLHRDAKELPSYALLVAKNGPKLKESVAEDAAKSDAAPPPLPPPPPPGSEGARFRTQIGPDGMPKLPPGMAGKGNMMMVMNGRMRMTSNGQTMSGFAEMLANQLGTPVADMTELKGKYDFTLDWAPDETMQGKGMMGMPPPPPPGAGEGGEHAMALPEGQSGPSIFTAVQDQLGLRLEKRKAPVEILVVDNFEKPTDN